MGAAAKLPEDDWIEVRDIEVRGQVLRTAVKDGPEDQPPLLMFNGIGANLELGFPFLRELTDRRAVIFDVPGVGGSPLPSRPYRPGGLARWAKGVCDALGYEKVDVSGVSWGGGAAQQFVHQYPRFCRKLVLAATTAGAVMVPGGVSVLSKMASPRRYTDAGYMRSVAADIYGGDFRTDEGLIGRHISGMKPQSKEGYAYQLLAMAGWTSAHWLWTIRQPTLVMSGTDDPLIPVINARFLAAAIPRARLHLVDNGHLFLVTRPRESALTVSEFLSAS